MYERILVPLDGSDFAALALQHARAIAKLTGAQLQLLQVIPTVAELASQTFEPPPGIAETSQDAIVSRRHDEDHISARDYLGRVLAEVSADGLKGATSVREGAPPEQILAEAGDSNADLIVLTAYGQGGAHSRRENAVFGGVADSVLRGARIPVLVVHP
jgi:nucleotide-binding universal stress UspA family protein